LKESKIQREIRLEAHKYDLVLFRNNVGNLKSEAGHWVRFGLCKGASDLIGWHKPTGKFTAIEVKRPGQKPRADQQNFIDQIRKSGGIAGVARSPDDLAEILTDCNINATL
jgi:hypothetical protein